MKRNKPKSIDVKLEELLNIVEKANSATPNRLKTVYRNAIFRVDEMAEISKEHKDEVGILVQEATDLIFDKGAQESFDYFQEKLKAIAEVILEDVKTKLEEKARIEAEVAAANEVEEVKVPEKPVEKKEVANTVEALSKLS